MGSNLEGEVSWNGAQEIEQQKREVEIRRLELEEKRFTRECEERDADREERKEAMKFEKQERLAMLKLLESLTKRLDK